MMRKNTENKREHCMSCFGFRRKEEGMTTARSSVDNQAAFFDKSQLLPLLFAGCCCCCLQLLLQLLWSTCSFTVKAVRWFTLEGW